MTESESLLDFIVHTGLVSILTVIFFAIAGILYRLFLRFLSRLFLGSKNPSIKTKNEEKKDGEDFS